MVFEGVCVCLMCCLVLVCVRRPRRPSRSRRRHTRCCRRCSNNDGQQHTRVDERAAAAAAGACCCWLVLMCCVRLITAYNKVPISIEGSAAPTPAAASALIETIDAQIDIKDKCVHCVGEVHAPHCRSWLRYSTEAATLSASDRARIRASAVTPIAVAETTVPPPAQLPARKRPRALKPGETSAATTTSVSTTTTTTATTSTTVAPAAPAPTTASATQVAGNATAAAPAQAPVPLDIYDALQHALVQLPVRVLSCIVVVVLTLRSATGDDPLYQLCALACVWQQVSMACVLE
jgi:hypothetical protein